MLPLIDPKLLELRLLLVTLKAEEVDTPFPRFRCWLRLLRLLVTLCTDDADVRTTASSSSLLVLVLLLVVHDPDFNAEIVVDEVVASELHRKEIIVVVVDNGRCLSL